MTIRQVYPHYRFPVLTAGVLLALTGSSVLAGDAEMLQILKQQMEQIQRQIETMESRLKDQESRQAEVTEQVAAKDEQQQSLSRAVQVYGEMRVSVDNRSGDFANDGTELVSNASRMGVQGEMPTTLKNTAAFYRAELRYETTDQADTDLEMREGFAGLKGNWGKLRLGRLNTEYKKTGTRIDPWVDNAPQARGGGRQGMSELHAGYFNNAADYVTPEFLGGLTGSALYSTRFDDSTKQLHNAGAAANYEGGQTCGAGAKYEAGPVFIGADWVKIDADSIAGGGVSNGDAWQVGANYQVLDNLSFAAMYEDAEDLGLGRNSYFNGIYRIGLTRLIAAYGLSRDRVADGNKDWNNWSIGAKYDLAKNSELLLAWNRFEDDTANDEFNTLTVGINARFGY